MGADCCKDKKTHQHHKVGSKIKSSMKRRRPDQKRRNQDEDEDMLDKKHKPVPSARLPPCPSAFLDFPIRFHQDIFKHADVKNLARIWGYRAGTKGDHVRLELALHKEDLSLYRHITPVSDILNLGLVQPHGIFEGDVNYKWKHAESDSKVWTDDDMAEKRIAITAFMNRFLADPSARLGVERLATNPKRPLSWPEFVAMCVAQVYLAWANGDFERARSIVQHALQCVTSAKSSPPADDDEEDKDEAEEEEEQQDDEDEEPPGISDSENGIEEV